MKHSKKVISMILAVCITISMMPSIVFAGESQETYNYVSIGASNVNGYGLRGYIQDPQDRSDGDDKIMEEAALDSGIKANANVLGYGHAPEKSYPALVKDALEKTGKKVKLSQLAISSMRAEELRILLDNNYYGDEYSRWRFVGQGNWFDIADGTQDGDISGLRNYYQTAVKDADLITVDIGINNFGVYLSYQLTSNYALDEDLSVIDTKLGSNYTDIKNTVKTLLSSYNINMDLGEYEKLLDTITYALVGFCYNFDKSMERIYELNPDATVVVVSIQNLLAGTKIGIGEKSIPLGDILGALINTANIYIARQSPYSADYRVADVRKNQRVEFFIDDIIKYQAGHPETLSPEMIDCFNVLDGNPGQSYDSGLHVKYSVCKTLIDKVSNQLTEEDVKNTFINKAAEDPEGALIEQLGAEKFNKYINAAYDAYAQIMCAGAKCDTIDFAILSNTSQAEKALEGAIKGALTEAVNGVDNETSFILDSDKFFKDAAASQSISVNSVKSMAALGIRVQIGNSFFGHPNTNGHKQIAQTVMNTLSSAKAGNGRTIVRNEIEEIADYIYEIVKENGVPALKMIVTALEKEGKLNEKELKLINAEITIIDKYSKSKLMDLEYAKCKIIARIIDKSSCNIKDLKRQLEKAKKQGNSKILKPSTIIKDVINGITTSIKNSFRKVTSFFSSILNFRIKK